MKLLFFKFLLVLIISSLSHAQPDIKIENAWIRAVPPVSKMTAVYMDIINKGSETDELIGANMDICKEVEIHTVFYEEDMMKMRKVDKVEIKGGDTVRLKPGGFHIMCIGIKKHPAEGEVLPVELKFKKSGTIKVNAEVRKR